MHARAPVYQFGPFEFDPAQFELRRGDRRQTLSASLNRLLLLFVERPGTLITREQIADTLWQSQGTVDVAAGINTAIRRLRTQLGEGDAEGVFIETVVGAGYRFAQSVCIAPVEAPPLPEPEPVPLVAPAAPARTRLWAGVAVVALCAAAGGWTLFSHRFVRQPAAAASIRLHVRRVTFDEPEDRLTAQAISPSGAYVAYLDRAGLTVRPLGNGHDRRLPLPATLRAEQIAWSPDESYLLVGGSVNESGVEAVSQIWRVPLTGGPIRVPIDDAALPAVAPDGRRIAFLHGRRSEIWTADADGGSPRKLAGAPAGEVFTCLLWSPQGDRIVADRSDRGQPPLTGAETTSPKKGAGETPEPPGDPDRAVYESYDARTGALLGRREGLRFDSAALLRDGTLLYPVDGASAESRMAIVQTDPATGVVRSDPRLIPFWQFWSLTSLASTHLTAAANGQAFSAILERPAIDVYTADLIAGDLAPKLAHIARLSHYNGNDYPTSWTADGKEVIFDSGAADQISVASQALAAPQMHPLAVSNANTLKFAQGQLSPDGRWLLFLSLSLDGDQVQSIDRIPAQGGPRETVHTTGPIEEFHCSSSATGRCVLREVEGKSSLVYYALDPVSGMGAELARTPWQPNILGDWSLSPDGMTVAMASHDPLHPAIQLVPLAKNGSGTRMEAAIKTVPVAGFGTTLEATWSAEGRDLFVETFVAGGYDLLWLTLDGHASLLRRSPNLIYAVPSPDGKKIAFPDRTVLHHDVWVGASLNAISL